MARLAALDLGSNSFHLLVADTRPGGRIKRVRTKKLTIRLGEPVARTGRLGEKALARARKAFADLVEIADDEGADRMVAVGTEALRVAEDGNNFCAEVHSRHGVPVQLLTGLDEAALSLRATSAALNLSPGDVRLGLDLGGGSFEIALGGTGGYLAGASLPIGPAKLIDRLSDPPRAAERADMFEHVRALVEPEARKILAQVPDDLSILRAIATAGSIRDIARLGLTMAGGAAPAKIRGLMVSRNQLEMAYARLCSVHVDDRMDLPGISKKRADLLPAAGIALLVVMECFELGAITMCDWGLREGVLLDVVQGGGTVDGEMVVDR